MTRLRTLVETHASIETLKQRDFPEEYFYVQRGDGNPLSNRNAIGGNGGHDVWVAGRSIEILDNCWLTTVEEWGGGSIATWELI